MLYNICHLFTFFLIYSVIGYLVEICFCSMHQKKVVLNRGFLIGPYLPIYGSSVVLMYYLLQKYADDPVALFVMSAKYNAKATAVNKGVPLLQVIEPLVSAITKVFPCPSDT